LDFLSPAFFEPNHDETTTIISLINLHKYSSLVYIENSSCHFIHKFRFISLIV